jgi:hypothetical protein
LRGIGAGLARGQILRRHKTVAHRAQQVAGQGLCLGMGGFESDQRKTWQKHA